MSEITEKYKKRYRVLNILSITMTGLPFLVYSIIGFIEGTIGQKVTLGLTLTVCALCVLLNIVFKYHIRSTIWILLIGIHVCLNNITPLLIIIALMTIIDEFILTPLCKKYKQKYIINNEIDERG